LRCWHSAKWVLYPPNKRPTASPFPPCTFAFFVESLFPGAVNFFFSFFSFHRFSLEGVLFPWTTFLGWFFPAFLPFLIDPASFFEVPSNPPPPPPLRCSFVTLLRRMGPGFRFPNPFPPILFLCQFRSRTLSDFHNQFFSLSSPPSQTPVCLTRNCFLGSCFVFPFYGLPLSAGALGGIHMGLLFPGPQDLVSPHCFGIGSVSAY